MAIPDSKASDEDPMAGQRVQHQAPRAREDMTSLQPPGSAPLVTMRRQDILNRVYVIRKEANGRYNLVLYSQVLSEKDEHFDRITRNYQERRHKVVRTSRRGCGKDRRQHLHPGFQRPPPSR